MHQSEDIAKARVDGSGFCIGGLFHMCGYLPAELVSEGFEAGLFDALKDHKPSCLYFVIIRINIQAWQEWKMR